MTRKFVGVVALCVCGALTTLYTPAIATAASDTVVVRGEANMETRGKDLYRAIFFGDGPEVQRFARVFDDDSYKKLAASNNGTDENTKQYKEFVSQVVEKVAAHDPKFFETFGVAITSGDPYKVEKAVTEAERVTKAVLPELSRTLEGGAQGLCVALAAAAVMALAVWSAAVVVNYAGLVNVETAAFVHHKFKLAKRASGGAGSYSKEKLIADITRAMQ